MPLLSARQLSVHFSLATGWPWQRKPLFKAVDGINLDLFAGVTLGVVGESGCGKSTLARALTGLQSITAGGLEFNGHDITGVGRREWRQLRRDIQMVFQDPLASLNPRMTVGETVAEPLRNLYPELGRQERWQRVTAMLDRVGLSGHMLNRYPHEFSGGQCQRIGIARALVVAPKVLICDEAVSALDVSIQAQILALLASLQAELDLAILFIAHDLAVVKRICERVMVMYVGRMVETASTAQLFAQPGHPYTRALLSAVPRPDPEYERHRQRIRLEGVLPSPMDLPTGCVFRGRCPWAQNQCAIQTPALRQVGDAGRAACHFTEAICRADTESSESA